MRRIDELLSNHSNDRQNPSNRCVQGICVPLPGLPRVLNKLFKKAGIAI